MLRIWQIAAGDGARDYSKVFLEHDIMFMSPGSFGPIGENKDRYYANNVSKEMVQQIANFCSEPKTGDYVLLRTGKRVLAIGRIPDHPDDQYFWSDAFGDVLGWDSQHCRRVQWETGLINHLDSEQTALKPLFANYKQQRTITMVHEDRISKLLQGVSFPKRSLRPLPTVDSKELSSRELGEELFAAGLANDSVERVVQTMERIRRLSKWYEKQADRKRPSEHEIVAHMIAPLMLGLGWSEQLMPIEWNRTDIAFFNRPPSSEKDYQNCVMICECKGSGSALEPAYVQAKNYIDKLPLPNCTRIITTDGCRLFMYKRPGDHWPEELDPIGYVNLSSIRRENIYPFGTSGVKTLIELIPWNVMQ
ncbi:hypothetical protein H7B90_06460 [Cohnella xylanilytica]|uniref:Uncharacterized protein n=1 Tax=Cohnella xylanilytica TaxID=557555 RepID=A0A841TY16_9BACL|nr:hypothetical protein [Cohnella xylanilytica]MBB6691043.1 hypothetical protein [Cohnella xylanilytica]